MIFQKSVKHLKNILCHEGSQSNFLRSEDLNMLMRGCPGSEGCGVKPDSIVSLGLSWLCWTGSSDRQQKEVNSGCGVPSLHGPCQVFLRSTQPSALLFPLFLGNFIHSSGCNYHLFASDSWTHICRPGPLLWSNLLHLGWCLRPTQSRKGTT